MGTTNIIPRTYAEAISAGYSNADATYQRGYVSRKIDVDDQPIMVAGGSRKGQLYCLIPCWSSTQYCIRQYLKREE